MNSKVLLISPHFPDFKWAYFRLIYVHLTQTLSVSEDTGLSENRHPRSNTIMSNGLRNLKNPREKEFSLSSLQNRI